MRNRNFKTNKQTNTKTNPKKINFVEVDGLVTYVTTESSSHL